MGELFLGFFNLFFAVVPLVGITWLIWRQIRPGEEGVTQFMAWTGKSLGFPVFLWLLTNLGWLPGLSPMEPRAAEAIGKGGFQSVGIVLTICFQSVAVITTYWSATSVALILPEMPAKFRRDVNLRHFLLWSAIPGIPCLLLMCFWYGYAGLGAGALGFLWPLSYLFIAVLKEPVQGPMYARAIAHINFGRYGEAELAIIDQLEKHPDNYEGWMLLAELYAKRYGDVEDAQQVVADICDQPEAKASEVSLALHRLADWHLKVNKDPESARRALEAIAARFPATHAAKMANQRANRLPSKEKLAQDEPEKKHFKAFSDQLDGQLVKNLPAFVNKATSESLANECVQALQEDPDNPEPRERLASILAWHLKRLDLAEEQIHQLASMPNTPREKIAEWHFALAGWKLSIDDDRAAAIEVLEALVAQLPQSPEQFTAKRWIDKLKRSRKAVSGPKAPMKQIRIEV